MKLRLVEDKERAIHETPPAGYKEISKALTGGRCLYCGHLSLSKSMCCVCVTCVCCPSKEETHAYD